MKQVLITAVIDPQVLKSTDEKIAFTDPVTALKRIQKTISHDLFIVVCHANAAKAEKCLLCHDKEFPKDKKKRNEYGMALSKFITKADYKELKADKPALKKKIENAFTEAGKLKSSAGETFAERIEAGKLPAAK